MAEPPDFDDDLSEGSGGPYRFDIRGSLHQIHLKLDATIATDREQNTRLDHIEKSLSSREIDLSTLTKDLAEREGASKLTAKLVGILGGIVIAGFLGLFGYLWSGNADDTRRDAMIERLAEKQTDHASRPGHTQVERRVNDQERRIDGVDRNQKALRHDVDEQDQEIRELRQRSPPRRR